MPSRGGWYGGRLRCGYPSGVVMPEIPPTEPHTWGSRAHGENPKRCTSCGCAIDWPLAKQPCPSAFRLGRLREIGEQVGERYTIESVRRGRGTRLYTLRCSVCGETGESAGYALPAYEKGKHTQWCKCAVRLMPRRNKPPAPPEEPEEAPTEARGEGKTGPFEPDAA